MYYMLFHFVFAVLLCHRGQAAPLSPRSSGQVDLLTPMKVENPRSRFHTVDHPISLRSVKNPKELPVQTNKFYANLLLGDQKAPVYMTPYSGFFKDNGMCFQYSRKDDWIEKTDEALPYIMAPPYQCQIKISAEEMGANADLKIENPEPFSVIASVEKGKSAVKFPLVQGQAFMTAIFDNSRPILTSQSAIIKFDGEGMKYHVTFNSGEEWVIYSSEPILLKKVDNFIKSDQPFNGFLQVSRILPGCADCEKIYDEAAGTYATGIKLSAERAQGNGPATYSFDFETKGKGKSKLLHFALPHHQQSIINGKATNIIMPYITKGDMRAYIGNKWTMRETELPDKFSFLPQGLTKSSLSKQDYSRIQSIARREIESSDFTDSDKPDYYFAGKSLAKYAHLCLVANDVLEDKILTETCMAKLKSITERFISNKNQGPLAYEEDWKGLISYNGQFVASSNFGNQYYNDHQFHYGYLIHTAAILGHIDKSWLTPNRISFINMLVRDVNNPNLDDKYFPFMRSFDWYNGHSWAKGLFESGDGKDQESTSEDSNFSYALKLWGSVIGDLSMMERGNLMLAIQKRSFNSYFLMDSKNTIQPKEFRKSIVSGILFENKIHHATYFSPREECIHGIHMLPLTTITPYIRTKEFVQYEWDQKLKAIVDSIDDGWKAILYADYSIANPQEAYKFFSMPNFPSKWLDDGASLTWYLTFVSSML